jgi:malonyl-CoA O-methyltransferase
MTALAPRDAYRLWAPTYATETAISFIEDELAREFSPPLAGKRLLDAGCGTGRRLLGVEASFAAGIDASPEMLSSGHADRVAAADLCNLPFAAGSFDVVWCRLVLGHLKHLQSAYDELARVCILGGELLVSDFHAVAAAAGHKRSFRDSRGVVHEIEHHIYDNATHISAAARSGFALLRARDGAIGPSVEHFYTRAGRHDDYLRDLGLPVVASLCFRRQQDRCES